MAFIDAFFTYLSWMSCLAGGFVWGLVVVVRKERKDAKEKVNASKI
jgi:hypothetical protein